MRVVGGVAPSFAVASLVPMAAGIPVRIMHMLSRVVHGQTIDHRLARGAPTCAGAPYVADAVR